MTQALLISMSVLFIHATTWDGMIMDWIKKIFNPDWYICKPLYTCPICMTPWWGSLIYYIFFWSGDWKQYAITILAASGISVINVFGIYIMDYCKSRTRDKDECC